METEVVKMEVSMVVQKGQVLAVWVGQPFALGEAWALYLQRRKLELKSMQERANYLDPIELPSHAEEE